MINKYKAYDKFESFEVDPKSVISKLEEEVMEKDPDTLKHISSMDLRGNVPPQLYELISGVVNLLERIEDEGK